jgi:putative effector of murein hydrolase LrgA (UPF0299 family)
MTDQDMLTIAAVVLLVGWWLWKNPRVAEVVGLVVLFVLICFGVAHAQTHGRRRDRRAPRNAHHRRR